MARDKVQDKREIELLVKADLASRVGNEKVIEKGVREIFVGPGTYSQREGVLSKSVRIGANEAYALGYIFSGRKDTQLNYRLKKSWFGYGPWKIIEPKR